MTKRVQIGTKINNVGTIRELSVFKEGQVTTYPCKINIKSSETLELKKRIIPL